MTKHKWHKEIKAWADGAEIESRRKESWGWREWESFTDFYWYNNNDIYEYRIKPQPKEPQYLYLYRAHNSLLQHFDERRKDLENDWKYLGKIKLEQDDEQGT